MAFVAVAPDPRPQSAGDRSTRDRPGTGDALGTGAWLGTAVPNQVPETPIALPWPPLSAEANQPDASPKEVRGQVARPSTKRHHATHACPDQRGGGWSEPSTLLRPAPTHTKAITGGYLHARPARLRSHLQPAAEELHPCLRRSKLGRKRSFRRTRPRGCGRGTCTGGRRSSWLRPGRVEPTHEEKTSERRDRVQRSRHRPRQPHEKRLPQPNTHFNEQGITLIKSADAMVRHLTTQS